MPVLRIDCRQIRGWRSFHTVFARTLGFPAFYGRNMDARIDCMTSLDAPEEGMTRVHVRPSEILTLHLEHADAMPREIHDALLDAAAFVNRRRIETGEPPVLAVFTRRRELERDEP